MAEYIAFLRGVNLGKRRLKMARLRQLFEDMNFTAVQTFIASGNVVFESRMTDGVKIEALIEGRLEAALGYSVDTFVRTRSEIEALAEAPPFQKADLENAAPTIHIGFIKTPLDPVLAKAFGAIRTDVDAISVKGRDYYWLCRIRSSDSKIWALPAVRALKLPSSTMRNRTTIQKIAGLYPSRTQTGSSVGISRGTRSARPDKT